MKDTTLAPHLLTIVRDYGHNKAVAWLDGEEELAKPDDDLCSFLSRSDTEWDQLTAADQDSLRDVYLESVKSTIAGRTSSPVTVEVPLGKPGGPADTSGSLDRDGTDVAPWLALAARVDEEGVYVEFGTDSNPSIVARFMGGSHKDKLAIADMIVNSCFKARSFSLTSPVSKQIDSGASLQSSGSDSPSEFSAIPAVPGSEVYEAGRVLARFLHEHPDFDRLMVTRDGFVSAADRQLVATSVSPPSPEKPVVQPTGSDSAGLLEECKTALEACCCFLGDEGHDGSEKSCDGCAALVLSESVLKKLNA